MVICETNRTKRNPLNAKNGCHREPSAFDDSCSCPKIDHFENVLETAHSPRPTAHGPQPKKKKQRPTATRSPSISTESDTLSARRTGAAKISAKRNDRCAEIFENIRRSEASLSVETDGHWIALAEGGFLLNRTRHPQDQWDDPTNVFPSRTTTTTSHSHSHSHYLDRPIWRESRIRVHSLSLIPSPALWKAWNEKFIDQID